MKKIDGGYVSLFEQLVAWGIPPFSTFDNYFYPQEHALIADKDSSNARRYNETPKGAKTDQLLGAFQPLVFMLNDVLYTLKPYPNKPEALYDLAQFSRGFGNLSRGIATLIIIVPVAGLFYLVQGFKLYKSLFSDSITHDNLIKPLSWLIDGVLSVIRGITQIATAPLTLFFKIPIRSLAAWIYGKPDICANEDIQRLALRGKKLAEAISVAEASSEHLLPTNSLHQIAAQLNAHYVTHLQMNGITTLEPKIEAIHFSTLRHTQKYSAYFNLFSNVRVDSSAVTYSNPYVPSRSLNGDL